MLFVFVPLAAFISSLSSHPSPTVSLPQDLLDTLEVCAATEVSLTTNGSANANTAAATTASPYGEAATAPQRRALPHQQQRPDVVGLRPGGGARGDRDVLRLKSSAVLKLDSDGNDDEDGTTAREGQESSVDDGDGDGDRDSDGGQTLGADGAAGKGASAPAGHDGGRRSSQATSGTVRTAAAAVGARAQELAAARFAGMRSAAEAKSAAAAAAAAAAASGDGAPSSGDNSGSGGAASFAKGVYQAVVSES